MPPSRVMARVSAAVLAFVVALPLAAWAEVYVPPELAPWVPWLEEGHPEWECALSADGGEPVCSWPSALRVELDDEGAAFSLVAWVDARAWVTLPGRGKPWPQAVAVDGVPAVVSLRDGAPSVRLEPGQHAVTGRFRWARSPDYLQIPPDVGLVALARGGVDVDAPRLDDAGRLWLREDGAAAAAGESDALRVSVYRRFRDGVPMYVDTRVSLSVSGRAREVRLDGLLLPGSLPIGVDAALPVRVEPSGAVRLFARAGAHDVSIRSLIASPLDRIEVPPAASAAADAFEVWVWVPNEGIRAVEVEGLVAVDPAGTSLPADWRGHSTFAAKPGEALVFRTERRGEPEPPPNRIALQRQLWLDLDGGGFTVRDRVTGVLHQGWRLDYGAEGTLGRVEDVGQGDDLLITASAEGRAGVELRRSQLDLSAEVRLDGETRELPAVGWDFDAASLAATLHLPPGWLLLAVTGADSVPGTWVGSWTLFDVFVLLVFGAAVARLLGVPWGIAAALAFVLAHDQTGAPRWVWFHLVATLGLLRVLRSPSRWRMLAVGYHFTAFVVLAVLLFSYVRSQLHEAVHPQAAQESLGIIDFTGGLGGSFMTRTGDFSVEPTDAIEQTLGGAEYGGQANALDEQMQLMPQSSSNALLESNMGKQRLAEKSGKLYRKLDERAARLNLQQLDPKAIVQTGPGLPSWRWEAREVRWNGQVDAAHRLQLWMLSPWQNAAVAILRVLAFLALAAAFAVPRRLSGRGRGDFQVVDGWRAIAPAIAGGLLVAGLVAAPRAAGAGTPPADTLDALAARLANERGCDGPCAVVGGGTLVVEGATARLALEVGAQQATAVALPGTGEGTRWTAVTVDALPAALRREQSGVLSVRVPAGVHQIDASLSFTPRAALTLQFEDRYRPRQLRVEGDARGVDGIGEVGEPEASVEVRLDVAATPDAAAAPESGEPELAPWYSVRRRLLLGLPWLVRTEVWREDTSRAQLFRLPLLAGEAVTTEDVRVEGGTALVAFARGEDVVVVESELQVAPTIGLVAPTGASWSEEWILECSQIWHCTFGGVPPVSTIDSDGAWHPTWKPWPGEKVDVAIERPAGAPGAASTIAHAAYSVTPGNRQLEAELRLQVRASTGGRHRVVLPESAELQEVLIDGQARAIRPDGRSVSLPLQPGSQALVLRWTQPWGFRLLHEVPAVDLGGPAANLAVRMHFGYDDWILATAGPTWGPAVRFWSHLVSLLVLGFLLSRLRELPLRPRQWLLLSLGFTQVPAAALAAVAVWFGAFAVRLRRPASLPLVFDLGQLVLVGGTILLLSLLFSVVGINLMSTVDMQISGALSSNTELMWYVDRVAAGEFPTARAWVLPILVWRGLMLVWSLWLALRVVGWMRWGWAAFSGGGYWRKILHRSAPAAPAAPAPPSEE